MARYRAIHGDVFRIPVGSEEVAYFQYVADDSTQLGSQVIRVFRATYPEKKDLTLSEILSKCIDFHCHVFLKAGVKFGGWEKVGHSNPPKSLEVKFRSNSDFIKLPNGEPISTIDGIPEGWMIWRVNEPWMRVNSLTPEHEDSEIGLVMAPQDVVRRIREGTFRNILPEYF